MRKMLVCCVILGGLSCPASAGERSGVHSRSPVAQRGIAFPRLIKDPATQRVPAPAVDKSRPQRFMLPAGNARLEGLPAARLTAESRQGAPSTLERDPSPEVTARAGGSYAVYDVLRAQPRPRQRRSPLGAAFVLRLDGNDDSPPFSVGGGGVAAAVWQAVPK
ncbi:hypothetical protein Q9Q95_06580 [Sphingomonas sp. DG1-23]|uniref:hypothetical protein n=1 Tax=Sphingomonas sp. DG1-23 TaxID=3068316 RepID=UPI00273D66DA|nr:hypothetical protein [Sphingomonas sp. DG1-23]MDP5278583.1 hypothetical protein [Sphingomonas sp. DG1-23]